MPQRPISGCFCDVSWRQQPHEIEPHVKPENEVVQKKLVWAIEKTKAGEPTVPSTVKEELATNPFMRVASSGVQKFANGEQDLVKVMGIVRAAKDNFVIGK